MHIGIVIYGSLQTLSGGYLYDRKLVEYLRGQGDQVEVISLPWRNYAAHLTDNLHLRLPRKLDLLIQDELNHPSLIFANRRKHRYPMISLVHHLRCSEHRPGWQNRLYRFVEKTYLQSVDGFIFNSKTTRNVVHGLLQKRKPSILAYPPTDRFGKPISEIEIIERAKSDELRVLFLGNVIYRKGLHTLLEAVKHLEQHPDPDGPKIRVQVVGSLDSEPAYARQTREFITANNLSSSVSLKGSLDREPLVEQLRQAHLLVVPSSYEGFGIVYLEGMGFGLPAIGTTAGGAGEIIEDGQTGYLIPPQDSTALAEHLQSLWKDRRLLTHLSLNARHRYLRQPSWNVTAKGIRDFLHSFQQA